MKLSQLPQGPAPEKPRLFASKAEKQEYEEYNEQCRSFVELIREEGPAIAARSDALHGMRIQKEKAEKAAADERRHRAQAEAEAARYKQMYDELKMQIDAKRLRALDIAAVAALLGYEKMQNGLYKINQHTVHITEKSYEFQQVGAAYGRNAIDFVCEHLRLTEGRPEVTPAEAIVRLAALVHDDETLRETALAGLADRAEEWLDGLKGQIDYARARAAAESPQEPLESPQGPPLEHQPGRQEHEEQEEWRYRG